MRATATRIRHHVIDMCGGGDGGHLGGSLSAVDILTVLYSSVMRVDPKEPDDPERDIFLLSKGHGAIALYATLAERGFIPVDELATFGASGSRLLTHPVRAVPGVELPTGSLGHGPALGLGYALAARLARSRRRVFVLVGDGELQEGSCWESIMSAAALGVDNLVLIVDRNGLQQAGETERVSRLEPLADRWRSFGWRVREVDGHDHEELSAVLGTAPWRSGSPSVVIARTVKGQGVPFVSGEVRCHYARLSDRMSARAHSALDRFERGSR